MKNSKQTGFYNLYLMLVFGMLLSCSDVNGPGQPIDEHQTPGENDVRVIAEGKNIILENQSGEKIYYFTIARCAEPFTFWVPSLSEEYSVKPGEKTSTSDEYEYIVMCCPGEKGVRVFYWHAADTGEGDLEPGEITSQTVEIDY